MRLSVIAVVIVASICAAAQEPDGPPVLTRRQNAATAISPSGPDTGDNHLSSGVERELIVPAGTKVPLSLKNAISTKTARVGDSVYAQTTFPVAIDNRMVIPAGTYVQGRISSLKRPGRLKGRAEILFHFTSMVFPSGYTVVLPGSVDQTDSDTSRVKDPEGTIQHEGEKGKDAATVAKTAGQGAAIGAIAAQSAKGAAIGGGLGAATGLAIGMLTRGSDIRLQPGTTIEMVFQRDLVLDPSRIR